MRERREATIADFFNLPESAQRYVRRLATVQRLAALEQVPEIITENAVRLLAEAEERLPETMNHRAVLALYVKPWQAHSDAIDRESEARLERSEARRAKLNARGYFTRRGNVW